MKSLICRLFGHRVDPDPGDLVIHCMRCGKTEDLRALTDQIERCACGCGNPVSDS